MESTSSDGDRVLVDTTHTKPAPDGVYVFDNNAPARQSTAVGEALTRFLTPFLVLAVWMGQ